MQKPLILCFTKDKLNDTDDKGKEEDKTKGKE
jgi:hypothetical protein